MNKENKLLNKIKHFLRRLNIRFLHMYGPKTYELYEHLTALLIRHYCKNLAYRRIKKLLDLLEITCPSKSALQYTMKRIPKWLWDKAIEITSGIKHHIIALDSTGFSRINPSYHYLRRIDGKIPKIPIKLSTTFDTKRKKFCTAKISILPRHDVKDAKYLLSKINAEILVADKAYDSNSLHEYCNEHNIQAHIPKRKNGKPRHYNFNARMKALKHFRLRTYHRRELIESGFHSLKTKFGSSVNSKSAKTIRADLYCKLLCHNLFGLFIET